MAAATFLVGLLAGFLWRSRHDIRREIDGTASAPEGWERIRPFVYRRRP